MVDGDCRPVFILCKEIGFRYNGKFETPELFVEFVRVIVSKIADIHGMDVVTGRITGNAPSENSGEVLRRVKEMLGGGIEQMITHAEATHDFIHEVLPEETYPTDHIIDTLSACVSAIRFGLERPCNSRHAAAAAGEVWKLRYGVSLFDRCTSDWQKDWIRQQFQKALTNHVVRRAVVAHLDHAQRMAEALREFLEILAGRAEENPEAYQKAHAALAEFDALKESPTDDR